MPSEAIRELISRIAQQYNLPTDYMLGKADYESRLNPRATSPTGARGLFQFTRRTGREYGLDRKAAYNPERNADAAARLTKNNADQFKKVMGRDPSPEEMYLMHNAGASGAMKLIQNPDTPAAELIGSRNVRVNLPGSMRSRANDITAQEYINLHGANIDKHIAKFKAPAEKTQIALSDTPSLKELDLKSLARPSTKDNIEQQIVADSSPTEGVSTMPRGYDSNILAAMRENLSPVQQAAMFPAIRGKGGRYTYNPMNDVATDPRFVPRLEKKEGGGVPAKRNETLPALRKDNTIAPKEDRLPAQMDERLVPALADKMRGGRQITNQDAGELPGKSTNALGKAGTAAAAVGAATYGDSAVDRVMAMLNPEKKAQEAQPTSPKAVTQQYNVDPSIAIVEQSLGLPSGTLSNAQQNPAVTSMAAYKVMPAVKEAMTNPQTAGAAMDVAKGVVSNMAKNDAIEAANSAGTRRQYLLQQTAGQPNFEPGSPQFDRMMELAVSGDSADVMRGRRAAPSPMRSPPPQGQVDAAYERPAPPITPAQQQAVQMNGAQPVPQFPMQPYGPGNPEAAAYMYPQLPYGYQAPMMDPSMMTLGSFYTGGGFDDF